MRTRRTLVLLAGLLTAAASPAWATPFAYRPDGSIIDTATDTVVGGVSGMNGQGGVAMNAAGTRVYLLHFGGSSGMKVIDTGTNTVIATVSAVSPFGHVAVHPSNGRVYATSTNNTSILVIDASTNAVVNTILVGNLPQGLTVLPDGSRVYAVTREPSAGSPSSVAVIDTASETVVARVPIPAGEPHGIAVNPSGTRAYAAAFDNGAAGGVYVIDTATNTALYKVGTNANELAVNPAGTRLYVGGILSGVVYVVDLTTDTVIANVPVAAGAQGIAVNPAGTKVYVLQNGSAGTRIIDAVTNMVTTTVPGFANGGAGGGLFIGPYCPGACSDLNPCTTDTCNPVGGCTYTNNTAPCADEGNVCTTDVCAAGSCTHPPVSSGTPCPDGTFCNGVDMCDGAGTCVSPGDPCTGGTDCANDCNEVADDCLDLPGTACSTDGNVCTDDQCNGAGACVHPPNVASCDDGLFCTLTDVCAGGVCGGTGDPCQGGSECANACNETADDCFDLGGVSCTADANPCTLDQCDGGGDCAHPPGNAGATCRSAAGQCDVTETCTGVSASCPADAFQPDGTGCDDSDACTSPDECTAGACTSGAAVTCPLCQTCDSGGGCLDGPRTGCKVPTKPLKAQLLLQDRSPDDVDQAKWKWANGQATTVAELGDPVTTDEYAFCVYDAGSNLLMKMSAPAGGTCGTKPCWKQLGPTTSPKGYKYKDRDGLPHDLDQLTLKAGLEGKAKMSLKARGANIPLPVLGGFVLPLTTQLQSGNGECYQATFSNTGVRVNTNLLFKAKSD